MFYCGCKKGEKADIKISKNDLIRTNGKLIDTLLIVDDSTYAPYEFNTTNRKGEKIPAGIIVDIWNLWSKKTGIPIKFKLTVFSDAIKQVEDGKADLVSGICPKYRDTKYSLRYSRRYYDVKVHPIIPKNKEVYFKSLEQGSYTFGICAGDVTQEIVANEYKNIHTIPYSTYSVEIDSLLEHKVSGILLEGAIFKYTLFSRNQVNKINDFVIMEDPDNTIVEPLHGASYDNKIINLVNFGLDKITADETQEIEKKWVRKYEPSPLKTAEVELIAWVKKHIALGLLFAFVFLITITNLYGLFLYFFYPYKLILLEPVIRKIPVINVKYQKFEISFSKVLFFEFLIFNQRTIKSFYEKTKNDIHLKAIDFLNNKQKEKYLTFPISIGEVNVGYMPLVDNEENIKSRLKNEINSIEPFGIIVLGGGGIGKTTIGLQIIEWFYLDPFFNTQSFISIPIDFYWAEVTLTQEDFDKKAILYIKNKFSSLFDFKVSDALFDFFYQERLLIIVVDSFSEYVSSKRQKISSFISEWRKTGNHFLITSRNSEYKNRFGVSVEIRPQLLRTAFLMNLIERTVINSLYSKGLSKEDSKRISDVFQILNRVTNDDGVTPLFCKMFTEVLYHSPTIDLSEQVPIGVHKYYEMIFEKYLFEIINKEESIEKSDVGKTVERLMEFGAFFAWKQVSINQTFSLNNYLSKEDISEFPDYELYLKLLNTPGSIIVESSNLYKYKFDPVAEILISKYLFEKYRNGIDTNNTKLLEDEFSKFLTNKNRAEVLILLHNLKDYVADQVRFLRSDQRSTLILEKINECLSEIDQDKG